MYRNVTTTAVALVFGLALTGIAPAADLAPIYTKAPLPPSCIWCGFYVGVNAGGDFDNTKDVDTTSVNTLAFPASGGPALASAITALSNFSAPVGANGFIGGGQIGYNWQWAPTWLVGLEADIEGVSGKGSSSVASSIPITGFPNTLNQSADVSGGIDYLGTVRGRLGFVPTPTWLIYGTGGLAYGGVSSSTSISQAVTGAPTGLLPPSWSGTGSFSDTRVGWAAGAGFEWMFLHDWTAKVEYLHYDLGSATYGVSPLVSNAVVASPFTVNSVQSRASFSGDIARVGINYLFH
jgi:outer membrane immunogenic protein